MRVYGVVQQYIHNEAKGRSGQGHNQVPGHSLGTDWVQAKLTQFRHTCNYLAKMSL